MNNELVKLKLAGSLLIPIAACAVGLLPAQAIAADATTGSPAATSQGQAGPGQPSQEQAAGGAATDTTGDSPNDPQATADDGSSQRRSKSKGAAGEPPVLKEVVVNGYAASLGKAIQDKFKAANIIDTISAEGIGQFPEQNIAESLQRVTGVQITRNQGEGQFISVRGLDPKFTDTLYNGRQLPSGSGTRAFDFQVLSGDFAQRVDVYKSPTADLPESGLAATVNVLSIRPLDYGRERLALTADGQYEQQAGAGVKPHLSALYTNTFFNNRLGWVVAFDLNERNVDDQMFLDDGVLADPTYTGSGTAYRQYGIVLNDQVGFDKRASAMSMLQFRVNDNLELRLDTLDSEFEQSYNWLQGDAFYPDAYALGPETTLSETVNASGVETQWTGTNVFNYTSGNHFSYAQRMTSNALAATLSLANWTINSEASFGQSREETTNLYVNYASIGPGATFTYNANEDPGGPIGFSVAGYNPENPNNYYFAGEAGEWQSPTTDKIWNFKVDADRPLAFGWLRGFQTGANYEDRTLGNTPNGINTADVPFTDMNQYLVLHNDPNWFSGYSGPAQFPRNWLTVNLNGLMAAYPLSGYLATHPPTVNLTQTTVVEEKSAAAYGQLNLSSPAGRLTGNVGVRLVHTEELSSGYVPAPDATLVYGYAGGTNNITYSNQGLFSQTNTYNNALPDLNLTYRITDDLLARFAAAQVMQRPDMNLLGESSSPNAAAQPPPPPAQWLGTLAEGNPNLKPYLSNQFDASLEWYFGPRSLLATDFFFKDVKNLILTNYFKENANVQVQKASAGVSAGETLPILFTVGQPQNAQATTLKGVEIAWQQPFSFLPSFLHAFGAEANFTHIWTQPVVLNEGQPALPVTGVSTNTYNLGIYYDTGKFGVHANYNYRSAWVADPLSYFGDGIFVKGYGQLDISGNYNVTRWLAINASVINATDSASIQSDVYGMTRDYELIGRRFQLGLHATF
jgi:iron complex outermembrane recepter protein